MPDTSAMGVGPRGETKPAVFMAAGSAGVTEGRPDILIDVRYPDICSATTDQVRLPIRSVDICIRMIRVRCNTSGRSDPTCHAILVRFQRLVFTVPDDPSHTFTVLS